MFNLFIGFGHGDSNLFFPDVWIWMDFLQDFGFRPGLPGFGFSWTTKKEKLIDIGLWMVFLRIGLIRFWTVSRKVDIGFSD